MYSLKAILEDPHGHASPEVVAWLANQLTADKDKRKTHIHLVAAVFTDSDTIQLSPVAIALLEHFTKTTSANWQYAVKGVGIYISGVYVNAEVQVQLDNASSCQLGHVFLHTVWKDIRADMETHIPLHQAIQMYAAHDVRYVPMANAARKVVEDEEGDLASDSLYTLTTLLDALRHDPDSNITGYYEKSSVVETGGAEPNYIHADVWYETNAYTQYVYTDVFIDLGSVISSSVKERNTQPAATTLFSHINGLINGVHDGAFRDRLFEEVTDMMIANLPETPQKDIDSVHSHRTDENAITADTTELLDLSDMCK